MSDEETIDEEFDGEELDDDLELDPEDLVDVLDEDLEAIQDDDLVDVLEDVPDIVGTARTLPAGEEEDEDEDLITADDVEADLDMILKDRMVAAEETPLEEEEDEVDDRGDSSDRLQPKRPDEQLCSLCFLLIRESAPQCPVGDDECPLFPR